MVSVMGKRGLFLVWLCLVSILPGMAQTEKLIDYVNPFVGTDGYGNVYPGAQIPFGGIQMSPDTDSKYYDAASGYKYNHSTLLGFSLTHLSGTGIPDLGDFLFIPGTGEMKLDPGTNGDAFIHGVIQPFVRFADNGVYVRAVAVDNRNGSILGSSIYDDVFYMMIGL